jgi:hypothetical protein
MPRFQVVESATRCISEDVMFAEPQLGRGVGCTVAVQASATDGVWGPPVVMLETMSSLVRFRKDDWERVRIVVDALFKAYAKKWPQ